jgi:hypothetical protein
MNTNLFGLFAWFAAWFLEARSLFALRQKKQNSFAADLR